MEKPSITLIDLYPYFLDSQNQPQFLMLKRAENKIYAGSWRMIGGKVESGETAWQAALRELKEETGLVPKVLWTVPTLNQFYDPKRDQIHHIPVFTCELEPFAVPQLDAEHTEFTWISIHEVETFIQWPEQKRILYLINQLMQKPRVKEWEIDF